MGKNGQSSVLPAGYIPLNITSFSLNQPQQQCLWKLRPPSTYPVYNCLFPDTPPLPLYATTGFTCSKNTKAIPVMPIKGGEQQSRVPSGLCDALACNGYHLRHRGRIPLFSVQHLYRSRLVFILITAYETPNSSDTLQELRCPCLRKTMSIGLWSPNLDPKYSKSTRFNV